jgi:hypothetical protein
MVQERFNNNRPTDSPDSGGIVIPEWARQYAAQPVERPQPPAVVASQTKAESTIQQPAAYDVEAMHARGRYINWLGDQYSRSQQNKDWYPGYGPGNGYYYPVRSMPVAPMPYTPIIRYPQPGNENPGTQPVNWPVNHNGEFPGQNGTNAFNPVRPPVDLTQPYNWNNPSQPGNPVQPFNPTLPVNEVNNPQNNQGFPGENGTNAYNPVRPPINSPQPYNWNNPSQPSNPVQPFNPTLPGNQVNNPQDNQGFPGENGTNAYNNRDQISPPMTGTNNPFSNQGLPGQGGNSPYYNWNNPAQPANPFNNQGFPGQGGNNGYYNWNNPGLPSTGAESPFVNPNTSQNNTLYNWQDAQQQLLNSYYSSMQAPWQGNSGASPFYNPNMPGMINGNRPPFYNWQSPQQPGMGHNSLFAWESGPNQSNPFYNWRNQAPPPEQPILPPDQGDYAPGCLEQPGGSTLSGMSLRIGPDGRQYTHNHLTGQDAPWPPVEPLPSGPALNRQGVRPTEMQTDSGSPQIAGMSLRVGPDGRQYTHNHVTGQDAPWPPNEPDRPDSPERKRDQFDKPSGPYTKASAAHWQRTDKVIKSMVGHSIQDYDSSIPETLGCARFVSVVLKKADNLPTKDATVEGLENDLRRFGFKKLSLSQAQPGDVIIAHRYGDSPGHAAIYVGDDMIANNSSKQRKIAIESVNKFHSSEYKSVFIYRKVK